MSSANGTLASKKDTSTLVRAVFEPGMLLQHEDLEQLNAYTRDLSRLLFRSFFGCGVVCGLVVKPYKDPCGKWYVGVGSGLALDCNGDPIYVPKDQQLPIDEKCEQNIDGPLWVLLCGSVKCCGPRTSMCSPDDEDPKSVCTRERDCFEIRIVKEEPKCACGWPDAGTDPNDPYVQEDTDCDCVNPKLHCYVDHYDGKCKCTDQECCCCGCDCILLARLEDNDGTWSADHRVRRFIRPVLMRDPQVKIEEDDRTGQKQQVLKAATEKKVVERKLQWGAEQTKTLEDRLRKISDENKVFAERLERIKLHEAEEQQKAEEEGKRKVAKGSTKKKEE